MARQERRMRNVRRAMTSVVALLAAAALLVGVLRANAVYFYCPFTQAIAARSCCAAPVSHAEAPAEGDAPESFVPIDCCQAKHIGSLPAGAVAAAPDVPSAPLLAIVPPIASQDATALARDVQRAFVAPSTGPPPPRPTPARTRVFLI